MKKTFICLANSKKYGERCIAGVEITNYDGSRYSVVSSNSQPKWLRPVSNREHGEVSAELVGKIRLLDIVEFDVSAECPQGYQSENVFFDEASLKVIGRIDHASGNVAQFQNTDTTLLFGNRGKAVHMDMIDQITYSLVLIRPESVDFYEKTYPNGNHQLRCKFHFRGNEYDLPVTDVDFLNRFAKTPNRANNFSDYYFTISLGVEHETFYYKLIAAIFYF